MGIAQRAQSRVWYPGFMLAPRPVIQAHKSNIITGNLGVKLRQSPSQSPKYTDFTLTASYLPGKVIIGIICPGVIWYISYFVSLKKRKYLISGSVLKVSCCRAQTHPLNPQSKVV